MMFRPFAVAACLLSCLIAGWMSPSLTAAARPASRDVPPDTHTTPAISADDARTNVLHSTQALGAAAGSDALARTATDTFYLYGGPNSLEGKFEDADGAPDWQDWQGVDLTEEPVYWQVSTFNAETLGNHGPGNHALWCGQDASQVSGWSTAPGYGNQWDQFALYESDVVTDLAVGQTVDLDFVMHYDTEPAYDYFHVEYDSAGIWVRVLSVDGSSGTNGEFPAPGVAFSDLATRPIVYAGNDYGYPTYEKRIRIRLRFVSDWAWSDEDGIWPTMGAVQIDDVTLTHRDGSFTEDFEGEAPYLFNLRTAPFCGDFSDVYPRFQENLDPCRSNDTPMIGFIDYGQEVRNGPGLDGRTSTGGSTSWTWDYGIPGGYVVNLRGGLSGGQVSIHNGVVSPPIDWDLPGSADDDPDARGAFLRFSMWRHLPLGNGVFYRWSVRTRASDSPWSLWKSSPFTYYGNTPQWRTFQHDVTNYVPPDVSQIQAMLRVWVFLEWETGDSTPSPIFDNVTLAKYQIGGPSLTTRSIDLPNDSFPASSSLAASTMAERDALDVRFDMAMDINDDGEAFVAGDSVTVNVAALLPGTTVSDVRMKWALRRNPFFEDAIRSAPAGVHDANVDVSGPVWTGEVIGQPVGTLARRHFDLPDEDFLYPGDQIHIYFEATDSDGRVTTLPADTAGFGQWNEDGEDVYDRIYAVHALPSIHAEGQPWLLVVEDSSSLTPPENEEVPSMLRQLGYVEGIDYDIYVVKGASSFVGNGIGSGGPRGHGATLEQMEDYSVVLYLSGSLSTQVLSNGIGLDKSDDLGLLTAWKALPGDRHTLHFGDNVVSATDHSWVPGGAAYVQNILGVSLSSNDVRGDIDGQAAPRVAGLLSPFTTTFAAFGGCPEPRTFDSIMPLPGAVAGHAFLSSTGSPYAAAAASVIYDRTDALGDRKVDFTFPFGLDTVFEEMNVPGEATSARTNLLAEILAYLSAPAPSGTPTSAPIALRTSLSVAPNPFNPRTEIALELERATSVTLEVFDLRGARVAVLHRGELVAGNHRFVWSGDDTNGKGVASGVYLVRADGEQIALSKKVVLVR